MKKTALTLIAGTAIAFTIPLLISFAVTEVAVHLLRKEYPDHDHNLLRKALYAAGKRYHLEGSGIVPTYEEAKRLIIEEYVVLAIESLFA